MNEGIYYFEQDWGLNLNVGYGLGSTDGNGFTGG